MLLSMLKKEMSNNEFLSELDCFQIIREKVNAAVRPLFDYFKTRAYTNGLTIEDVCVDICIAAPNQNSWAWKGLEWLRKVMR